MLASIMITIIMADIYWAYVPQAQIKMLYVSYKPTFIECIPCASHQATARGHRDAETLRRWKEATCPRVISRQSPAAPSSALAPRSKEQGEESSGAGPAVLGFPPTETHRPGINTASAGSGRRDSMLAASRNQGRGMNIQA